MGFEVKITGSDGRRYNSLADMVQAEGEQLIDDKKAAIERAIRDEYCSTHGQHPSVRVSQTGGTTRYEISACCEDLRDRAQQAADIALRS